MVVEDDRHGCSSCLPVRCMINALLEARDVVVRQGGRVVVDGASIDIGRGEIVVIRGASGSGKTTLLRALAGLVEPTAGTISLNGHAMSSVAPRTWRRRVAFVQQRPRMLAGTVAENLAIGPRLRGADLPAARVCALLEEVGLGPDFAERSAAELSGGEQQRVAIARALANDPELVLLDEPTSALDEAASERVIATLKRLAGSGIGVAIVTHDEPEALATSRYVCESGRLRKVAAP
jgi:putative ABC transport system ATP-binding protein